jgi:predicted nucleic acid-binding protein
MSIEKRCQSPEVLRLHLPKPLLAFQHLLASALPIVPVDAEILELATGLYHPDGSKKHTMFDATVAAIAKKIGTQTLFSFDGWYRRLGFTLLGSRL